MAESAVALLIDKLTDVLVEEVELSRDVRGDVEYIRDELEHMKSFLKTAADAKDSDHELKAWIEQVRDVAYEAEDLLDEFMLRLEHHSRDDIYSFPLKILHFFKYIKTRNQFGNEIRRIKLKISNISKGQQKYLHKINTPETDSTSTIANNRWYDARGDALLLKQADLVGIDKPKHQLIWWLLEEDPRLKVVSVVGMGGLGKSTLVKHVYDDNCVKEHFEVRAWITVSQSVNIEELLQDMARQLFGQTSKSLPKGLDAMTTNVLKALINEFLQNRRYVIVLDDVWSIYAWDAVKYALPNNNHGSRVMLTTRIAEIANTTCIESNGNIYNLNPLAPQESWTLFCKKTFQGNSCPPHLNEISQRILQRCEGLPLAIVAVGGLLSNKDRRRIDEWEMVYRSFAAEIEGNYRLQSAKKILSLSYVDLPYYLKSCLLYLIVFPEDHSIECTRLTRLWIAEGFIKEVQGKTLEDVAESYLHELFNRSLLQASETRSDGRVHTCRVHNILREIMLLESRELSITVIANEQNPIWPGKVRRLSLNNTLESVGKNNSLSHLRSLFLFRIQDSVSNSSLDLLLSPSFRLLRVLDLRGAPLEIFPDGFFKLIHLRYLSLRDTKVKVIPSSIGKLLNLETLDLKHANISQLPIEISKLQRLRHLLVYHFEIDSYMPYHNLNGFKAIRGIGELRSLQKLCFLDLDQDQENSIFGELGKLKELRRLGITKLRREDGIRLCSCIQELRNLRSLNIHSVEEDELIDLQNLSSPPQFLQRLYLHGSLQKLPHWISSLHSLIKLQLRWSQLKDDPLEALGGLPNLVEFQLRQAYDGKELNFHAGWFPMLKILLLDELEDLRRMSLEEGAATSLEELTISSCQMLEEVPSGIEHLSSLKKIQFFDMPDDLCKLILPKEPGEEFSDVPRPQVSFIKWENRQWKTYTL